LAGWSHSEFNIFAGDMDSGIECQPELGLDKTNTATAALLHRHQRGV